MQLRLMLANNENVPLLQGEVLGFIVSWAYVSIILTRRMVWFVSDHYNRSYFQIILL